MQIKLLRQNLVKLRILTFIKKKHSCFKRTETFFDTMQLKIYSKYSKTKNVKKSTQLVKYFSKKNTIVKKS